MRYKHTSGFAIAAAIFILVVLSAASLFLVSQTYSGQQSAQYAMNALRAYHAASSGLEWGIYQSVNSASCNTVSPITDNYGMSVTVTCSSTAYSEGGGTTNLTTITATAEYGTYGSTPDYVKRQMRVTVTDAP